MRLPLLAIPILIILTLGCQSQSEKGESSELDALPVLTRAGGEDKMMMTNLDDSPEQFAKISQSFSDNNPGYGLSYLKQTLEIPTQSKQQVVFVQQGGGTATLSTGESSKISVGDIILLSQGVSSRTDSLIDYVIFTVPEPPPDTIPVFIRPDWDENITDTPGGCATETNAYRRILLTWLGNVGPYLYKSINAHRVRIMDSFTHYHPVEGGFDEFYLVQMALPDARIVTSHHTEAIIDPDWEFDESELGDLVTVTPLNVGDIIYLPRGVIHRGVGGVLAQVITIPGFVPDAELGVDHHLKRINDTYKLEGHNQIPFNEAASEQVVIK